MLVGLKKSTSYILKSTRHATKQSIRIHFFDQKRITNSIPPKTFQQEGDLMRPNLEIFLLLTIF